MDNAEIEIKPQQNVQHLNNVMKNSYLQNDKYFHCYGFYDILMRRLFFCFDASTMLVLFSFHLHCSSCALGKFVAILIVQHSKREKGNLLWDSMTCQVPNPCKNSGFTFQ